MTLVYAFRDSGWIDYRTDYQQWNHACRAFNADLKLVYEHHEIKPEGTVVIIEEQGDIELSDFEHPEHCTYVFGRSGLNGLHNMIEHDHVVRIKTPKDICLFGITAVGIVLRDRMMKNGDAST